MILAQFIENSGLKDQIGGGVVLTGGFSKMEGIRDLAVATFGSMPVRIAKPKEMDGLFENLQDPEYSSAVGLVMYSASSYTPYEIDVNKKVRHANETPSSDMSIDFSEDPEIPEINEDNATESMVSLPSKKEKKGDEAGVFSKIWNWATQLF